MFDQTLSARAQLAYEAAINSLCPDWRAVAELFRAAVTGHGPKQAARSSVASKPKTAEIADYKVDRIKLKCASPRIAVRFMDGEGVFTHVPSAPGSRRGCPNDSDESAQHRRKIRPRSVEAPTGKGHVSDLTAKTFSPETNADCWITLRDVRSADPSTQPFEA
jgi:hypothetical protein